jgi:hypothetical protein
MSLNSVSGEFQPQFGRDNVSQLDAARREETREFLRYRDTWMQQVICDRGANASHCVGVMVGLQYLNRSTYLAWPGVKRIAADLGLSERQVKRAFAQLVKRGHLVVATRGGGRLEGGRGKGRANVFKPVVKRSSSTTAMPVMAAEYGDIDDTVSGLNGDMDGSNTVTSMSPHFLKDHLDEEDHLDKDVCEAQPGATLGGHNLKAQSASKEAPTSRLESDLNARGVASGRQASPARASKPKAHGLTDAEMFKLLWGWFPRRAPSASYIQAEDGWRALSEIDRRCALSRLGMYRAQVAQENPLYRTPHPHTYLTKRLFDGLPDAAPPVPIDWKTIEAQIEGSKGQVRRGELDHNLGGARDQCALCVLALIASNHVKTRKVITGFLDLIGLLEARLNSAERGSGRAVS